MIEETLINRLLENLPKTFHQEIRDWADSQGPSPRADYWRLQAVESAVAVDTALLDVCPQDVLDMSIVLQLHDTFKSAVLDFVGLDRLLWVAASRGRGSVSSAPALKNFVAQATDHFKAMLLSNTLSSIDDNVLAISLIPKQEFARRALPDIVRYRWVSRLIFDSAATITQRHPVQFEKLNFLMIDAVDEVFNYIAASRNNLHRFDDYAKHWQRMSEDARRLCETFATSQTGQPSVSTLLSSTRAERTPFVLVEGVTVPVALQIASLALEGALYAGARDALTTKFGDWFEMVVEETIARVAPWATRRSGPRNIPSPDSDNAGEVDFAFGDSSQELLIGEVKGYAIPESVASLPNALSAMAQASDQLRLRLERLKQGLPLVADDRSENSDRAIGLGVTLHSYAGALWSSEALTVIEGIRDDMGLMPLTQTVIVIAAMESLADLRKYLAVRAHVYAKKIIAFDEVDVLLACVNPKAIAAIDAASDSDHVFLKMHHVEHATALATPFPPHLGPPWLRQLFGDVRHVLSRDVTVSGRARAI